MSVGFGLPLEVAGGATADGIPIDQNNPTETTNQLWIFPSLGASSPRYIYIYIYIYIYMYMCVCMFNTGTMGTANQLWIFTC